MKTDQKSPILIKSGKGYRLIYSENIISIECDSYICEINLLDGDSFSCTHSLKKFEEELLSDCLIRINYSTIVNIKHVKEIRSESSRKKSVIMCNGDMYPISYRRWPDVLNKILLSI